MLRGEEWGQFIICNMKLRKYSVETGCVQGEAFTSVYGKLRDSAEYSLGHGEEPTKRREEEEEEEGSSYCASHQFAKALL